MNSSRRGTSKSYLMAERELEEKEVQTEMKASGSFIHGGEQCFLMFKLGSGILEAM